MIMGVELTAQTFMDAAYKNMSPETLPGVDTAHGISLPEKPAEADAVEAFKKAMAPEETQAVGKVDEPATEKYIHAVTDIFRKEDLSHADLFRVQVLSSVAHVEITRNSSISKSIDDGMRSIIKTES